MSETRSIRVYGLPAPQGSKSFKGFDGRGHAYMPESSKNLKPWRDSVVWAYREDAARVYWTTPMDGPLWLTAIFYMPRPKKPKYDLPAVAPDLSKLVRSTEDALKVAGAIADDSRIVVLAVTKVFESPSEPMGAVIQIGTFKREF